jgi:hypothetical protein
MEPAGDVTPVSNFPPLEPYDTSVSKQQEFSNDENDLMFSLFKTLPSGTHKKWVSMANMWKAAWYQRGDKQLKPRSHIQLKAHHVFRLSLLGRDRGTPVTVPTNQTHNTDTNSSVTHSGHKRKAIDIIRSSTLVKSDSSENKEDTVDEDMTGEPPLTTGSVDSVTEKTNRKWQPHESAFFRTLLKKHCDQTSTELYYNVNFNALLTDWATNSELHKLQVL